jgi:hypothetical protein
MIGERDTIMLWSYVEAGATLLDAEWPRWQEDIHLEYLNMAAYDRCVLGQLFDGNYRDGVRIILGKGAGRGETVRHGFECPYDLNEERVEVFEVLDALWEQVIEARMGVSA